MGQFSRRRWLVVALLLAASVLNYVDRQAVSILSPTLQREFHLSDGDYAWILNLFLIAYTVSYVLSGRIVDRIGVRLALAFFVGWWSLANLATSAVHSFLGLCAVQVLLGLGEAGNWTAGPKAVREWFPPEERGLALGLCTLGATLGATLAPVLILFFAGYSGWKSAFVATGTVGLFWLVPWLRLKWTPSPGPVGQGSPEAAGDLRLGQVLGRRDVWFLLGARLLTDPVWYFFQFWFAKYLYDVRHVGQQGLRITWVVFLAADVGTLAGGWLSGRLIRAGSAPSLSRIRVMRVVACCIPVCALVPFVDGLPWVMAVGMAVACLHLMWLINLTALVVDLVPAAALGKCFGVIAAGSTLGGMGMNWAVAHCLAVTSYHPIFIALACLHPLAFCLVWKTRP